MSHRSWQSYIATLAALVAVLAVSNRTQLEAGDHTDHASVGVTAYQADVRQAFFTWPTKPGPYQADCKTPKDREEADLRAQRRMAEAAEDFVTLTDRQIWIGALGLGAIIITIVLSIRATRAAENQVRLSREALIAEQRAWIFVELSIGSGGFSHSEDYASADVSLRIENIGKTPALFVHTQMTLVIGYDDVPERLITFCREHKLVDELTAALFLLAKDTIGPGVQAPTAPRL